MNVFEKFNDRLRTLKLVKRQKRLEEQKSCSSQEHGRFTFTYQKRKISCKNLIANVIIISNRN